MATSAFRNKNLVRPVKSGAAKRNKLKAQARRLAALGVSEEAISSMTPKEVKQMIKEKMKA